MGGVMFCLLVSSVCYLFLCYFKRLLYVMFSMDYVGIVVLILMFFYFIVYYFFMCYFFFCSFYMGFMIILGIVMVLVFFFLVFDSFEYRSVRVVLFFGMGFLGVVLVLYKFILFLYRLEVLYMMGYEILMGVFYGIGVLVYVMSMLERWMFGKFDMVGYSY